MRFKRQEPFRYQLGQPLSAELIASDGQHSVLIHDISPHGMKLEAKKRLPFSREGSEVEVSFAVGGVSLTVSGRLVWERPFARIYYYGIRLHVTKQEEERLIEAIKQHAAESRRMQ
ncbi:PilZ domain-containing protein [Geobacillus subterraneus]|uniref:PilZ domain-containing protein n=1 Tax=Geobacillus subterraneus TaxID=129338 RepID=UPI002AC8CE25|nr:PilZ domain-containing protein [Geobacillus subterraneus]WPZ20006.1 PilZ domain-containing protein [Geobacillus subterraneus]